MTEPGERWQRGARSNRTGPSTRWMGKPALIAAVSAMVMMAVSPISPADADGHLTFIDGPGATDTFVQALNNSGDTGGYYTTDSGGSHSGFVRSADGTFITVDGPGATETFVEAVNDSGDAAGSYTVVFIGPDTHGFVRTADGTFTTFDVGLSTFVRALNDSGATAGFYQDAFGRQGFARAADGTVTFIDGPGATDTFVQALNNLGDTGGYYTTDAGGTHSGFVRTADGTFITIDGPGATETFVEAVNNSGDAAGYYTDAGGTDHGFVRTAGGTFTTIDAVNDDDPFDTWVTTGTFVRALNDSGDAAGSYTFIRRGVPVVRGFVQAADGTFTDFEIGNGAFVWALNDSDQAAGFFQSTFGRTGIIIDVEVTAPRDLVAGIAVDLETIRADLISADPRSRAADEIADALKDLDKALERFDQGRTDKALGKLAKATKDLTDAEEEADPAGSLDLTTAKAALTDAARKAALADVDDAAIIDPGSRKVAKAYELITEGDALRDAAPPEYKAAIEKYKKAAKRVKRILP